MTFATIAAPCETTYNPEKRRVTYSRACSRCGVFRQVRDPRAARNLCVDCVAVLSRAEAARWAA